MDGKTADFDRERESQSGWDILSKIMTKKRGGGKQNKREKRPEGD
jgi:hypothetical protein